MAVRILTGDCRELLATLPDASVQCVVTSPPYFGLRDYGTAQWDGGDPACDHLAPPMGGIKSSGLNAKRDENGYLAADRKSQPNLQPFRETCGKCGAVRVDRQIGLEPTLAGYIAEMVAVFRSVRRVLRDDGTVFLNVGDSYCSTPTGNRGTKSGLAGAGSVKYEATLDEYAKTKSNRPGIPEGMKSKDLMMVPARLAIALVDDGWYLRSDIVWSKPNPMPESVTDRPTSAHEHIFLLTKQARYYYDADAIAEPSVEPERVRNDRVGGANGHTVRSSLGGMMQGVINRNARNVWTITTRGYAESHFATFPPELPRRCILAGSREGDTILDPFLGAGTTLLVADRLGRDGIGIELNPEYAEMARRRITNDAPMFAMVAD